MALARCTQCRSTMTHTAFDQHDCPALPGPPNDGENWSAYLARCDEFTAAYHAANETQTQQEN